MHIRVVFSTRFLVLHIESLRSHSVPGLSRARADWRNLDSFIEVAKNYDKKIVSRIRDLLRSFTYSSLSILLLQFSWSAWLFTAERPFEPTVKTTGRFVLLIGERGKLIIELVLFFFRCRYCGWKVSQLSTITLLVHFTSGAIFGSVSAECFPSCSLSKNGSSLRVSKEWIFHCSTISLTRSQFRGSDDEDLCESFRHPDFRWISPSHARSCDRGIAHYFQQLLRPASLLSVPYPSTVLIKNALAFVCTGSSGSCIWRSSVSLNLQRTSCRNAAQIWRG